MCSHRTTTAACLLSVSLVAACSSEDAASAEDHESPIVEAIVGATELSSTGLYGDIATGEIAPGVEAYAPAYALWSDGATKRRWVSIPDSAKIDVTDMDRWVFPEGTRFWKEFSRDDVRIETRLLEKTAEGWRRVAFVWNDAGTDAEAAPDGVRDAAGTEHDVPNAEACNDCHGNGGDGVLGFSAIQLSHDDEGVNLARLVELDWVDTLSEASYAVPGNEAERGALGYLHANCGSCHNDDWEKASELPMRLHLETAALGSVEETSVHRTTVGVGAEWGDGALVAPGDPGASAVIEKMSIRGKNQMPPTGTERIDEDAVAVLSEWIRGLAP